MVARVELTHPDKVLYPALGLTKRDLAQYWEAVIERALPHLRDRPLSLVRCPAGQHKACFYQKHLPLGQAPQAPRVHVREGETPYAYVDGLEAVVALVQLGVLELHVWGARVDQLDRPDQVVFDLDPAVELSFGAVATAAQELRARLEAHGLTPFVRLTGGKGLHVLVPITPGPWTSVKAFAHAVASEMSADAPERYTANPSKDKRNGKVFIDYLRNDPEATSIAAYSVRARPKAPVALPIAWDDLRQDADEPPLASAVSIAERLTDGLTDGLTDPWADFEPARVRLP